MRSPLALRSLAAVTRATPPVRGLGRACQSLAEAVSARWTGGPVVMRVHGLPMLLDPREGIDRALLFTPQWQDREEWAALRRLVRPGDTCVDVGANIGSYTLLLARLVGPSGHVVAVEASPDTAPILRENVRRGGLDQVTVHEVAVTDRATEVTLWLQRSGNRGASGLTRHDDGRQYAPVVVPATPLATLVTTPVRLMKMDIEGHERTAMAAFLEQSTVRPEFILVEQWTDDADPDGVIALLVGTGYAVRGRYGYNRLLVHDPS